MQTITVNGDKIQTDKTTLLDLLSTYDVLDETVGVAVAVNETLVVKNEWVNITISDGDTIEIVKPFAGG